ncbi:GNAT family N-acetyltransferase [Arcticibacterium luteifluviistationis]|uniref:GNAT family N-acetyltransferase n=1 Tax=Arcticibacterium luteifluviistationis TaxID=1784714 RepID=A0A2Z4GBC2_9BACT|nr:GNAT family N-acetyltransferase [Arcticibacterium luteifluviistationis]AWV98421.1 GNAT family N-acetyltransferase [Arcticibacterium luteifluviistationis]
MIIRKALPSEMEIVRTLFKEYALELNVDLCFQSFDEELENLPGVYAEPIGCILVLENTKSELQGVVGLKKLEDGVCEMKRLYVAPDARKDGNGRKMAIALLEEAKAKNYKIMKLDTIERLVPAVKLYEKLGFVKTEAYNYNPDGTVLYFQKEL